MQSITKTIQNLKKKEMATTLKNQIKNIAVENSGYILKRDWYGKYMVQSSLKKSEKTAIEKAVAKYGMEEVLDLIAKVRSDRDKKAQKLRQKALNKANAAKFGLSVYEYLKLKEKSDDISGSFRTGYSMGEVIRLKITKKDVFPSLAIGEYDSRKDYGGKYKGRETHGDFSIFLSLSELRKIEYIHGLWTVKNRDGSAKWLISKGQKQHFDVVWQAGYCVGASHSTVSLQHANQIEADKIDSIKRAKQRQTDEKAYFQKRKLQFIGIKEFQRITNACTPGIIQFCNKHGLNPEYGYNIGYLLSLNDSTGNHYFNQL